MYYARRKDKNCMSKTVMRSGRVGQLLKDKHQKEKLVSKVPSRRNLYPEYQQFLELKSIVRYNQW